MFNGRNKNMNQQKMMKTAATLDTVCRVLRKIEMIAMIVLVVAIGVITVVHFINPDAVIGTDFNFVDVGNITLEVPMESAPTNRQILVHTWIIALFAIGGGLVLYSILLQAEKILQPMKEGNPFHLSVAKNIRTMGVLLLALTFVENISQFALTAYANSMLKAHLLSQGSILSITSNFELDLTGVLVFFILLLISYVFQYGAQLQQLSDETL